MGGEVGELWGYYTKRGLAYPFCVWFCGYYWALGMWLGNNPIKSVLPNIIGVAWKMRLMLRMPGRKGLAHLEFFLRI